MNNFCKLLAALAAISLGAARAAPDAIGEPTATKPVAVKGRVMSIVSVGKTEFKSVGGNFGISGRSLPSRHWIVVETKSLDEASRKELSRIARLDGETGLSHPIFELDLGKEQIFLKLFGGRSIFDNIKVGTEITLEGYSLTFNNIGSIPTYTSITSKEPES